MGRDIIEIKKLLNKASKIGSTSSNDDDDDKKNKPVKEDDIKKIENKK